MYFPPSTSYQVNQGVVPNSKPIATNHQGMGMVNSQFNLVNQQGISQLDAAVDLHKSPYTLQELASDAGISAAALCFYQADRMVTLETQCPYKSQHELVTMVIHEWHNTLTLQQKSKHLKTAVRMGLVSICKSGPGYSSRLVAMNYMDPGPLPSYGRRPMCLDEMLKREPKKPPQNGYSLFTSEHLAKYVNVEPQKRLAEVARIWRESITLEEKKQYNARNKALLVQYQRQLDNLIETLSPDERSIYEDYCRERNNNRNQKKKLKNNNGMDPKKKNDNKKKKDHHPHHHQQHMLVGNYGHY
ncbi:uncharacterized protein LOC141853505 isoform X1 [Brevipalpus obovatus]|uniref:uncharacterized protein LOC141853505 isoform X1 n=1 Tax=Brevipalpus obovatus TaxID=246614 RepID=UPI003D9E5372